MVRSAHNLESHDLNGFNDPYVKLCLGRQTATTRVRMNTNSPVWNEHFVFGVNSVEAQQLQLSVYDYDTFKHDDHIGSCRVGLSHLPCSEAGSEEHDPHSSGVTDGGFFPVEDGGRGRGEEGGSQSHFEDDGDDRNDQSGDNHQGGGGEWDEDGGGKDRQDFAATDSLHSASTGPEGSTGSSSCEETGSSDLDDSEGESGKLSSILRGRFRNGVGGGGSGGVGPSLKSAKKKISAWAKRVSYGLFSYLFILFRGPV